MGVFLHTVVLGNSTGIKFPKVTYLPMTLLRHRRYVPGARTRMTGHVPRRRFSALLAAVLVTATVSTANPTLTAQADVFYGNWIKGRIEETFHRLGGHAKFGDATTPESDAARGGKFQVFANASSIYWHPNVSGGVARQVEGRIRDKWRDLGWENSRLKYPTTDEIITPDGKGRFNHFEGGSIYWSPATDAHQIEGLIGPTQEPTCTPPPAAAVVVSPRRSTRIPPQQRGASQMLRLR